MNSTGLGRQAEDRAADYLVSQGFTIINRNWRVKAAEIDIVAERDSKFYFIEVKYRKTATAGSGLDYITTAKLRQMRRAAELWLLMAGKQAQSYELSAVEVSGLDFRITAWLPTLT